MEKFFRIVNPYMNRVDLWDKRRKGERERRVRFGYLIFCLTNRSLKVKQNHDIEMCIWGFSIILQDNYYFLFFF